MKSMRDHDSRIGTKKPDDCRFTVLNATYYSATHKRLETSDFRSYGLADSNDTLTFVGELFSDNPNTSNSEILCTRWGGNLLSMLGMMKCKGEGLREILEHTLRHTNYSDGRKPTFISTDREFRVIMKNLNYDTQKS